MKDSTQLVIIAAGLGITAWVLYKGTGKAVEAVAGVAQAVNPLNPNNAIAGALNKVGAIVADDKDWTLGGWIYDLTHTDPLAAPAAKYAKPGNTGSGSADPYDAHLMRILPIGRSAADDLADVNPWATPPSAYGAYAFGA